MSRQCSENAGFWDRKIWVGVSVNFLVFQEFASQL